MASTWPQNSLTLKYKHFRSLCMKFSFSLQSRLRASCVLALPFHHQVLRTGQNADKTALREWNSTENRNGIQIRQQECL
jgi:hypothetical protein